MPWIGAQVELERSTGHWRIIFEVNSTEVRDVKNAFRRFAHEGCSEAGWSSGWLVSSLDTLFRCLVAGSSLRTQPNSPPGSGQDDSSLP